jgi:YjbE family integral membrane protein
MNGWSVSWDAHFLASVVSIVAIDLLLAGDNAVVIAMAVRSLPTAQRRRGIVFGALAAVFLRVVLTFFVAQLLRIEFVKLVGGLLILWVAMKLFTESDDGEKTGQSAAGVWEAVKIIVVADATMSLDNMLAVGGASHGNPFLLLFGLVLSIPFVVFASDLLSRLMDRFTVIVYAGAGILGKVSAEMLLTDPFVQARLPVGKSGFYAAEALFAAGVILMGWLLARRSGRRRASAPAEAGKVAARTTRS